MNRYIVIFIIFSFLGWIWESIYCTIQSRAWANRGFLFGPICPIYGFGSIVGLVLYDLAVLNILPTLSWWHIFLIGFIVSMLLEYPTSWILEKSFHARWWDYTKIPWNINGRTSVPTSIAFGLASILIMKFIMPFADNMLKFFPDSILNFFALFFISLISVDITLTISALTDFQKRVAAIDNSLQNRMTDIVSHIYNKKDVIKQMAVSRITVFRLPERKARVASHLKEKRFKQLLEEYNNSEIIRQMDNYIHHGHTTTLEHCQNVAWVSYLINKKLKLNADEKKLIELSMMHDLFLYDWHDKRPERKTHAFDHPDIACNNAIKHFDISKKDQEIIRSHMWPINIRRIPKSKEAIILCIADKYCALIETLRINDKLGLR